MQAVPEAEISYLPKRTEFILNSGTISRELLLDKGEKVDVRFKFSPSELQAALKGPPDPKWLAFYCPIDLEYQYSDTHSLPSN